MQTFHDLKVAVSQKFQEISEGTLFSSAASKEDLWNTYLGSFPEGTNPIYRERTTYDCNCCKQFIRSAGGVLSIVDNELVSIWDVEIGGHYQVVADALSKLTKEAGIYSLFLNSEGSVGTDKSIELNVEDTITYHHFHQVLPREVVITNGTIGRKKGDAASNKSTLERSVKEVSYEAIGTVISLINQNSLYRGAEHLGVVEKLKEAKNLYHASTNKELFLWTKSQELGRVSSFLNTVIGTLLKDLSLGEDIEVAVGKFESKVAPSNYKRPKALVTKKMVEDAQNTCKELGLEDSLPRRFANVHDISVNKLLFVDRADKEDSGVWGQMFDSVVPKSLDKVEEVSVDTFINKVLPTASEVSVLMDSSLEGNLVSLISPVNKEAPSLLKWDNGFSLSYNGEVADSMKTRVKEAGGDVNGLLRFSLQWNEEGRDNTDLDAHAIEPTGTEIYYMNRVSIHGGRLDVDITTPNGKTAVENITWKDSSYLASGEYQLYVKDYSGRGINDGFRAEVEVAGTIHNLSVDNMTAGSKVLVATVNVNKGVDGSVAFDVKSRYTSSKRTKEVWGVKTNTFVKAKMIMESPNYWDGNEVGNKHTLFMLEDCKNPTETRGFYNEFLRGDLDKHRKVFEILGSKMMVSHSDDQLSGLGFSSTGKGQVVVQVKGSFNRIIKVKF